MHILQGAPVVVHQSKLVLTSDKIAIVQPWMADIVSQGSSYKSEDLELTQDHVNSTVRDQFVDGVGHITAMAEIVIGILIDILVLYLLPEGLENRLRHVEICQNVELFVQVGKDYEQLAMATL